MTNGRGHYTFSQLGPAANPMMNPGVSGTGLYRVVFVLPPSMKQMSAQPRPILISRGGTVAKGMNLLVARLPIRAKVNAPLDATIQRRLTPEA